MNGKKIVGWLVRDGIAAEGCSPIGAGSMGGENYCGNLLWQSSLTLLFHGLVLSPKSLSSDEGTKGIVCYAT